MNFKPLRDNILVRRVDAEQKTTGGIIIPDSAQEKPQIAEVIAVGPGKKDKSGNVIPMSVKAGDRVLISKWGGTEVKMNNEEHLVLPESDVMGIV